jgi:hypothetical protein
MWIGFRRRKSIQPEWRLSTSQANWGQRWRPHIVREHITSHSVGRWKRVWVVTPCSDVVGCHRCCLRLHPEDGGSKVLRNISYRNTKWRHNPEDLDLGLHRCENLKCRCSAVFLTRRSAIWCLPIRNMQLALFCEHGNEPSGCVWGGQFLADWVTVSFSTRTLLHGVGWLCITRNGYVSRFAIFFILATEYFVSNLTPLLCVLFLACGSVIGASFRNG